MIEAVVSFLPSLPPSPLPLPKRSSPDRWRKWAKARSFFWGELFCCGYCFGHWVAAVLVLAYRPRLFVWWWPVDYLFTALVIAWLSAFQWAALCLLMEKAGK